MNNLEFYKEEIKQHFKSIKTSYHNLTYDEMLGVAIRITYNANTGNLKKSTYINYENLLDWLCEEHQILDKEEKEYLSNIVRPFRKKFCTVYKKRLRECRVDSYINWFKRTYIFS